MKHLSSPSIWFVCGSQHLYGPGPLKQVAASLGMSLRQVGRDAKDMVATFGVGDGFRDALLVLRLRAAVLLLAAEGASVQDVADSVKYGSTIALARAFRDAKLPAPSVIQAALAAPPPNTI